MCVSAKRMMLHSVVLGAITEAKEVGRWEKEEIWRLSKVKLGVVRFSDCVFEILVFLEVKYSVVLCWI